MNRYYRTSDFSSSSSAFSSRPQSPISIPHKKRYHDYKTYIFGCFNDIPLCVYGTFCPFCLAAQNWAYANGDYPSLFHFCLQIPPFWTRQAIRKRKGMKRKYFSDCLAYAFCFPCAICQDARELNI